MKDASAAIGRIAKTGHLNFEGDRKQKLCIDLRHGDPFFYAASIICCVSALPLKATHCAMCHKKALSSKICDFPHSQIELRERR